MKTEEQILDILRGVEARLVNILSEEKESNNRWFERKIEEFRSQVRAEVLTPTPPPMLGLPAQAIIGSFATGSQDVAIWKADLQTKWGGAFPVEAPRAGSGHVDLKLKANTQYAVVVAIYELPGEEKP